MRILIFGCGYLGGRVAAVWREAGHEVLAVTRSSDRATELEHLGLTPVVADVTRPETLSHLPQVDLCLYAVGFDRSGGASKREVYVQGLGHVLQHLVGRCSRLIYISSSSVYGQDAGEWVDANSPCNPLTESGEISLDAENSVRGAAVQFPGGVEIVRLSGIYGPNRLLTRVDHLRAGQPLGGRPDAWLNLIHVADAATAVVRLSEQSGLPSSSRTFLLSDDAPVLRGDFYGLLAQLTNAPPPQFDTSLPTRSGGEGTGKRCCARIIKEILGLQLEFPSFRDGLPQSLRESR